MSIFGRVGKDIYGRADLTLFPWMKAISLQRLDMLNSMPYGQGLFQSLRNTDGAAKSKKRVRLENMHIEFAAVIS